MTAVKDSERGEVIRQHLCFPRGGLHNWILMVIMHSTGSLEGLFVETILKWEFLVVQFDIYLHF